MESKPLMTPRRGPVKWVANRTCKSISGSVYASDYDRQQKIARVKVEMIFTGLIERIFIDFIVNR